MPKKYFKKFLPSHESIQKSRWLRSFGTWLHNPKLWHLHRRSVAAGVAIGLFCGLIPGPFQMMGAAALAVLFHANFPVALFTTLYTNPLTIAPLYLLAYKLGALVTGQHDTASPVQFSLPEMSWSGWYTALLELITAMGKPFAIGLPLLAVSLALLGYIAVRVLWKGEVLWQWRRRSARRKGVR